METKIYDLQDQFLQSIRNQRMSIQVFLVNGIRLVGQLEAFDNYSLLLKNNGTSRIIYKHTISTIFPSQAVTLKDRFIKNTKKNGIREIARGNR